MVPNVLSRKTGSDGSTAIDGAGTRWQIGPTSTAVEVRLDGTDLRLEFREAGPKHASANQGVMFQRLRFHDVQDSSRGRSTAIKIMVRTEPRMFGLILG